MGKLTYIWTNEYVGGRIGPEIEEEGDRTKPFSDKYWSKVETLPLKRLKEIQEEKLLFLVRYAYEKSPFYRRKWDAAKVHPNDIKGLDDITKLPLLTQKDFEKDQEENPPWGTAPTSPPRTQFQYYQTSGTMGKPRLWTDTKQDLETVIEMATRALYAQGIRPGWRGFFAFPFPPFMGFWHIFFSAQALGCQNVPKGPIGTFAWLKLIQRLAEDADNFLVSTPTYAIRQLEAAKEGGLDPKILKIKRLVVSGEPGYSIPATNSLLTQGFGAQVHDQPGSTEHAGPILFSCEHLARKGELSDHITADSWLVEVLDPKTLEPVAEDKDGIKRGVICVTALSQYGLPAIRMLLGDYINVKERGDCECGRTLPIAIGAIRGRYDDCMIIKGVNIYPSIIENSIRTIPGLSNEYRIKRSKGEATVIIEPLPEVPANQYPELIRLLREDIKTKTTVTMEIEVRPPGSLPKLESKTKRIIEE